MSQTRDSVQVGEPEPTGYPYVISSPETEFPLGGACAVGDLSKAYRQR